MINQESFAVTGVYRCAPGRLGYITDFPIDQWERIVIDGFHITDKNSFLEIAAKALQYPEPFGRNWDAFFDYLIDLSWLPSDRGLLILFSGASLFLQARRDEFETATDIFRDAADFWKTNNRPFVVLIESPPFCDLPEFPYK